MSVQAHPAIRLPVDLGLGHPRHLPAAPASFALSPQVTRFKAVVVARCFGISTWKRVAQKRQDASKQRDHHFKAKV